MAYTPGTITLSGGGLSITLGLPNSTPWQNNQYPRNQPQTLEIEYTANNTPNLIGTESPYPSVWTGTVLLKTADVAIMRRLAAWSEAGKTPVTIDDYVEPIAEADRTRALATDATETSLTNPTGWTEYFAKFSGFFSKKPEFNQDGAWIACDFQIVETSKTTP